MGANFSYRLKTPVKDLPSAPWQDSNPRPNVPTAMLSGRFKLGPYLKCPVQKKNIGRIFLNLVDGYSSGVCHLHMYVCTGFSIELNALWARNKNPTSKFDCRRNGMLAGWLTHCVQMCAKHFDEWLPDSFF
jgi:hypothetical protein